MARRAQLIAASRMAAHVVVGALFIYAGWHKAVTPDAFIRDIWNYRLLPEAAAFWVATYLPYLEILGGVALIAGRQRSGARLILTGLLVVFCLMLGAAWVRGLDISCGCFGSGSTEPANYPLLLARNALLLTALGWSVATDRITARLA